MLFFVCTTLHFNFENKSPTAMQFLRGCQDLPWWHLSKCSTSRHSCGLANDIYPSAELIVYFGCCSPCFTMNSNETHFYPCLALSDPRNRRSTFISIINISSNLSQCLLHTWGYFSVLAHRWYCSTQLATAVCSTEPIIWSALYLVGPDGDFTQLLNVPKQGRATSHQKGPLS